MATTSNAGQPLRAPRLHERVAQPVEIAKSVLYLASDDASFVTGTVWLLTMPIALASLAASPSEDLLAFSKAVSISFKRFASSAQIPGVPSFGLALGSDCGREGAEEVEAKTGPAAAGVGGETRFVGETEGAPAERTCASP